MRKITTLLTTATCAALLAAGGAQAQDKKLESIGISVGLLGNPFFVATIKGIEDRAREINPDVQVTSVSADYDLNKQASQIDNFIAAEVDIIMLNAVDANAIAPAVKRAKAAGIVVAAFDVSAPGADVTVMTDNVDAGRLPVYRRQPRRRGGRRGHHQRAAKLVDHRPGGGLSGGVQRP